MVYKKSSCMKQHLSKWNFSVLHYLVIVFLFFFVFHCFVHLFVVVLFCFVFSLYVYLLLHSYFCIVFNYIACICVVVAYTLVLLVFTVCIMSPCTMYVMGSCSTGIHPV